MNYTKYRQEHPHSDILFILLLLCVFSVGSLLFVIYGAEAYDTINSRRESNFQRTTPLFYLASKIRRCEGEGFVRIEDRDDIEALVITDYDSGEPCETWIYEYDGFLRELYIDQGASFALSDGTALLESCGLSFLLSQAERKSSVLTLSAPDEEGLSTELTLVLRGDPLE